MSEEDGRAFESDMKKQIMDRLLKLWEKHSALRLGQLIGNVFHSTDHGGVAQYFVEDFPLIEELEKHYGKELTPEPPASSSQLPGRGFRVFPEVPLTRYQESYGDDDYYPHPYESDSYSDYDLYLERTIVFYPRYDHSKKEWVCDCSQFRIHNRCGHCYRYRREEEVIVNPEYL